MATTFSVTSDPWVEAAQALTPVEERNGRWYKRDDLLTPDGRGGINGSKLRQLIWLISRAKERGAQGVVNGASVHSPQLCMSAIVGKHFGLPVHIILGGTKPETSIRHDSVRLAKEAGATFDYIGVGYNPALQRAVKDWQAQNPGWFRLCYGITTEEEASSREVEEFHRIGAAQTANIPPMVQRLIVPMGSANSVTSILYGLALNPPAGLKTVTMLGIGPTRLDWLHERLEKIERASNVVIRGLFERQYHHDGDAATRQQRTLRAGARWTLEHYDLHKTKFVAYGDKMPYTSDGIALHPTYEGKMMTYMERRADQFTGWWDGDGRTMLWIVGSEPK